ncbi:hypothetical protein REPUB_Repub13aG0133400 [Reevesia pubescens]
MFLWNRLWQAYAPNKIKVFGWRFIHGLLPVSWNLWRRKIIGNAVCPRCYEADETVIHAIKNCARIRNTWGLSGLATEWLKEGFTDPKAWLTYVAKEIDQNQFDRGLFLCWSLWNARNAEVINTEKRSLDSIVSTAKQYAEDFTTAQEKTGGTSVTVSEKWKAPNYDQVKINFDGATNQQEKSGGCGAVIRDHKGQVLGACAQFNEGIYDPLVTEAYAAVKALIFAAEIGCRNIILEGDALQIINRLNNTDEDTSYIGHLILEGKTRLGQLGNNTAIHARKEANLVAHLLAKSALVSKTALYWIDDVPDFLLSAVDKDCNHL